MTSVGAPPPGPDTPTDRSGSVDPSTLPPVDHAGRRRRARVAASDAGADVLVVTSRTNVRYLSGFTGSYGAVVLHGGGDLLVTDARYDGRAAAEAPSLDRHLTNDWVEAVLDVADEGATVAFEGDHVSWSRGHAVSGRLGAAGRTATATTGLVERHREVKDAHELAAIEAACRITAAAFTALLTALVPGRTEREVARDLLRRFEELGGEEPAFPPIVASGPHSAIPHHEPGGRRLRRGDLVKLDIGTTVAGYRSDMTRTVALGEPDADLVAVHDVVAAAQRHGLDAARVGREYQEVDDAARGIIAAAGHGDRFTHGVGHGVGLEIHERPLLGEGLAATLRPGTVLTVEPGIYLPGRGGVRIEDTAVVTTDGAARPLTTAPRELLRL